MNLLTGSMTPEQFQQYQQEQQQAFFRWQQSQILNRDLDNLQQNPPSFTQNLPKTLTHSTSRISKKGGSQEKMARKEKMLKDGPKSRHKSMRRFWYRVLNEFQFEKNSNRTIGQVEIVNAYVECNWQKFNAATNGPNFGVKSGENDVEYLKRAQRASSETEAAERAFEAQAEKDRTLMRLEELRFLATSTKDLDEDDAYWIKKQKKLIKNKMKNDLGDEDDEDEDE
ncbi:hypothetical protein Tco_1431147 [Tanacetum coccineum]